MKLAEAQELSLHLAALLEPACERVVVAGSIRREKAEVKDVELVALPLFPLDVFGMPDYRRPSCLNETVDRLIAEGRLEWDGALVRRGSKYKRLLVPRRGIALDLFLADHLNFGNILAIRTGNAKFSESLMIAAKRMGLQQKEGYLHRQLSGKIIPCESEEAYFRELGLQFVPPVLRTDAAAEALWRGAYKRKGAA